MKNYTRILMALLMVSALLFAAGCEDDGDPQAESDWVIDVTANPSSLLLSAPDQPGESQITVTVFDDKGRPQSGIGVRCSTTAGTLASNGASVETNGSGVMTDTLSTVSAATVRCSSGSASGDTEVTIDGVNERPIAVLDATPDEEQRVGREVVFSGSQSDDLDGFIDEYRWQIVSSSPDPGQPGTENITTPAGESTVRRTYTTEQELDVQLIVVDDDGATSSPALITDYRIVANQTPTAEAGNPVDGLVQPGGPSGWTCVAQVDGCDSRDPDGTILTWRWAWGDNTAPTYNSAACIQSHSYFISSTTQFEVTLTVFDDGDGSCGPRTPTGQDPCDTRGTDDDTTNVLCTVPETSP